VVCTVHDDPFHLSAKVPPSSTDPTAVQLLDDVHDTSERMESLGLGVFWMDHFVPFQRSARMMPFEVPWNEYPPTAVQSSDDVQDTPERSNPIAPDGWGVFW
jgi:hypothetical protein